MQPMLDPVRTVGGVAVTHFDVAVRRPRGPPLPAGVDVYGTPVEALGIAREILQVPEDVVVLTQARRQVSA